MNRDQFKQRLDSHQKQHDFSNKSTEKSARLNPLYEHTEESTQKASSQPNQQVLWTASSDQLA